MISEISALAAVVGAFILGFYIGTRAVRKKLAKEGLRRAVD